MAAPLWVIKTSAYALATEWIRWQQGFQPSTNLSATAVVEAAAVSDAVLAYAIVADFLWVQALRPSIQLKLGRPLETHRSAYFDQKAQQD